MAVVVFVVEEEEEDVSGGGILHRVEKGLENRDWRKKKKIKH